MPSIIIDRYTRDDIKTNKDKLYVFGDNFLRKGYGGQAAAARGEPNAVGIVTKRQPSNEIGSFLTDQDYSKWVIENESAWIRIEEALKNNKTVVWPKDGLGTGLANLKKSAPKIWAELQRKVKELGGASFA